MKRNKEVIKGYENQSTGNFAQKVFEEYLKYLKICFFRIEDGEKYPSKFRKSYIRKPQPFDYILMINNQPIFVDVKSVSVNRIPLSLFIRRESNKDSNKEVKLTSTQKQYQNFLKIYKEGWKGCYFAILQKDKLNDFFINVKKTKVFMVNILDLLDIKDTSISKKKLSVHYDNYSTIDLLPL